jgi:hypothetical protein
MIPEGRESSRPRMIPVPMRPLDYQSTPTLHYRQRQTVRVATFAVVLTTIVVNGIMLSCTLASGDGYLAMAVAFFVGPVANGLILLIALASIPAVRHASRTSVALYGWSSLIAPLAATLIDYVVIVWVPLHGG